MGIEKNDASAISEKELVDIFKEKAGIVSAIIHPASNMENAFEYVVDICSQSAVCEILVDDSRKTEEEKSRKILAAPCLSEKDFNFIKALCDKKDILCIKENLYSYLGGVNVGLAIADLGVAASGTCVLNCKDSEKRLATMISEICILILSVKNIRKDLTQISDYMSDILKSNTPSTITYITGASRTSDIERVLTIGAHGPLELHIVLLED